MFLYNPTPGNVHNSRKCFWTLCCLACSRLCLMKVGSSCHLRHFDCFLTPFSVSEVYPLCPMWCRLLTITTARRSSPPVLPPLGLWHSLQVKSSSIQVVLCMCSFPFHLKSRKESLGLHPGEWLCHGPAGIQLYPESWKRVFKDV